EEAVRGAAIGAITAPLLLISLQVKVLRAAVTTFAVVNGFAQMVQAFRDNNYPLATFRAASTLTNILVLAAVNRVSSPTKVRYDPALQKSVSSAGLKYGYDPKFGNRVLHVLDHTRN